MERDSSNNALDVLSLLMQDEIISARVWELNNRSLNLDDVAGLLRCSKNTVRSMIERGQWVMVSGPNGQLQMTYNQFKEQQRLLLQYKKRRR